MDPANATGTARGAAESPVVRVQRSPCAFVQFGERPPVADCGSRPSEFAMRTSSVFNILVKFAGIAVCGLAHAADAELPAWFAGDWCGKKDGATIEEHWLAPAGGSMLATSRTTAPARPLEFEFLRVQLV